MRARLRSYGETSTRTRSPGRMRMRNRRILPATCPSTSWPLSSCTLNIALGSASTTSPSNSTFSSFAKPDRVLSSLEGLGAATSDRADVRRLRALRALAELVLDLRALREGPEPVALDRREVHECVLPAVVGRDEPEPLLVAEPLHDPSCHFPHDLRCIALDRRKRTYPSSGAGAPPPGEAPSDGAVSGASCGGDSYWSGSKPVSSPPASPSPSRSVSSSSDGSSSGTTGAVGAT